VRWRIPPVSTPLRMRSSQKTNSGLEDLWSSHSPFALISAQAPALAGSRIPLERRTLRAIASCRLSFLSEHRINPMHGFPSPIAMHCPPPWGAERLPSRGRSLSTEGASDEREARVVGVTDVRVQGRDRGGGTPPQSLTASRAPFLPEHRTPRQPLPQWRYPMESRFTLNA